MVDAASATLIQKCIGGDHRAVKKILVAYPHCVNVPASNETLYGSAPLHFAAQNGHLDVCKILVERGADVNLYNKLGKAPLHYVAAEIGPSHVQVIQLLVDKGALVDLPTKDANANTPAHIAAREGNLHGLNVLKRARVSLDKPNAHGATPTELERTWRVNQGKANANTLFFSALAHGDADTAAAMLEAREVGVNDRYVGYYHDVTPLIYVAGLLRDEDACAKVLLTHGADVNATDERGRTALHYAAQFNNAKVVSALLAHNKGHPGALVVDQRDDNGDTALHIGFFFFFHYSIANMLLNEGANPLRKNDAGETPLSFSEKMQWSELKQRDAAVHDVALRALFLPYSDRAPLILRAVGRRDAKKSMRYGVKPLLFILSLLSMVFVQPVMVIGSLFGPDGFKGLTQKSLQRLFVSRYTAVVAPLYLGAFGGIIYLCAVLMPHIAPAVVSQTSLPILASYFGVILLMIAVAIIRGIRDDDYRSVLEPSPKFRMSLKNIIAVVLLVIQFVQLFALSYHPLVPFPSNSGEKQTHDAAKVSLLDFGGNPYTQNFVGFSVIIFLWALIGANTSLALGADKSVFIRALFPFLGHTFLDYFVLDLTMPLLTNAAFLPVLNTAFGAVACTVEPTSGASVLERFPSITCWQGSHIAYVTIVLLGLLHYVPTATFLGIMFLEQYGDVNLRANKVMRFLTGPMDLKYIELSVLIERPLKAIVSALSVFLSDSVWANLGGLLASYTVMFLMTIWLKPCRDGPSQAVVPATGKPKQGEFLTLNFGATVNRWRALSFFLLMWKMVCSMVCVAINDRTNYFPVYLQYIGGAVFFLAVAIPELVVRLRARKAAKQRALYSIARIATVAASPTGSAATSPALQTTTAASHVENPMFGHDTSHVTGAAPDGTAPASGGDASDKNAPTQGDVAATDASARKATWAAKHAATRDAAPPVSTSTTSPPTSPRGERLMDQHAASQSRDTRSGQGGGTAPSAFRFEHDHDLDGVSMGMLHGPEEPSPPTRAPEDGKGCAVM